MITMLKTFGERVREQRERKGWSIARCADEAGWPWPRWKRIEEDEPRRQDGSLPQLRRETVLKVAEVLSWDTVDALAAAGYAYIYQEDESLHQGHTDTEGDSLSESFLGHLGKVYAGIPPGRARDEWKRKMQTQADLEADFLRRLVDGE